MKNIDFKEIKPKHIAGIWHVKERIVSKSDPASIFASATQHHFLDNGIYKVTATQEIDGKWEITYATELIRNPLINFMFKEETVSAMITRLQCDEDCVNAQLTIYLSTGLELVLFKGNN